MDKITKLSIGIVVAIVLFTGAYMLYNSLTENFSPENTLETQSIEHNHENDSEASDYSAPNFTVEDKDGNAVTLESFFGKPIVLNMWASWCPPCKAEMPHFEEAYKENSDIVFMMINMTSGDNRSDAEKFIKEEGYTFPVYFDTDGIASYVYNATSLPMTIFIDKNGDIVTYANGSLSKEQLQQGIDMIR
ncbi:MAG: TlpA family protein disulfide reductase [Ruminococcus sp.]|nr:TlpA family protein disulfide reductase [Ruminococcus sp.]